MSYANVIRNSGAGSMLLPYRTHRGGSTAMAERSSYLIRPPMGRGSP